jgi:hypothetical protein
MPANGLKMDQMNRRSPTLWLLAALLACLAPSQARARRWQHPKNAPKFVAGELILRSQPGISEQAIIDFAAKNGCALIRHLGRPELYHLKIFSGMDPAAVAALLARRRDLVRFAGPNLIRHANYVALSIPNDPYYQNNTAPSNDYASGNEWNVAVTQLDKVWNTGTGGMSSWGPGISTVLISDLDTGINSSHEDLASQTVSGYNAFNGGNNTSDGDGHGTQVASLISADTNNGLGICGGAYGCRNLPVKISNDGNFPLSEELAGISWALGHGAKVINMSFGGEGADGSEQSEIDAGIQAGVLFTASSGNAAEPVGSADGDGDGNQVQYPAGYPGVLAVGATNDSDQWEYYSTWGSQLFCASPDGVVTCSNAGNSSYNYGGDPFFNCPPGSGPCDLSFGTSFAAPAVAALAGMLISSGVPAYECVSRIAAACDKVDAATYPYSTTLAAHSLGGWSDHYGYGRLNDYRAICALVPPSLDTAVGGMGSNQLSWSAPGLFDAGGTGSTAEPLASFHVYRGTAPGGPYTLVQTLPISTLSWTDTAPAPGVPQYYVVRAVNSNNFETRASNELSATVYASPTPSPSITPTFTISPTWSDTPTITPTPTATPSFTDSPTKSPSPTVTPTPAYAVSALGKSVLAPVPARQGRPVCLYFEKAPQNSDWQVYDLAGGLVAHEHFHAEFQQCWDTGKDAPGIYFVRLHLLFADGTDKIVLQKIALTP